MWKQRKVGRSLIWPIAASMLFFGIALSLFQVTIRPVGSTPRSVATLLDDKLVAVVGDVTIRERDMRPARITTVSELSALDCADDFDIPPGMAPTATPLHEDVLALDVDGEGVCLSLGQVGVLGDLRIKVEDLGYNITHEGEDLSYPNSGDPMGFRMISYWIEPGLLEKMVGIVAGLLMGIGASLAAFELQIRYDSTERGGGLAGGG